jgi:hypothetical protein
LSVTALLVTALSIASAIALIDDLDAPHRGFIVVSPQPMQTVGRVGTDRAGWRKSWRSAAAWREAERTR